MADYRTKAQKLRDLINHPRTGVHEREAALLALRRMGERPPAQPKPPPTQPRPRPEYDYQRQWFGDFFRQTNNFNTMNSATRAAQRAAEEFAEAVRKVKEEAARARAASIPPCPGCGHEEADHVAFRCYTCFDPRPIGTRSRAAYCGWMFGKIKREHSGPTEERWYKAPTSWRDGARMAFGYMDDFGGDV